MPSIRISDDDQVQMTKKDDSSVPVKTISLKEDHKRFKYWAATTIIKWVKGFLVRWRFGKCSKEIQRFNKLNFFLGDEDYQKSISEDSYEQHIIDTKKAQLAFHEKFLKLKQFKNQIIIFDDDENS